MLRTALCGTVFPLLLALWLPGGLAAAQEPVTPHFSSDSVSSLNPAAQSVHQEEIERLDPGSLGELLESRFGGAYSLDVGARNPLHRALRVRGPSSLAGCPALPSSRNWTSLDCPGPVGHELCAVCGPMVVVDGLPLAPEALANLHIGQVERVELIAGPAASLLYGMDAAEGVVSITTRRGDSTPAYAAGASLSSMSSPYTETAPTARSFWGTASGAAGEVGLFAGLHRQQFDGHVPSYDGRRNSASFGLRTGLGRIDVGAFARWSEARYGDPGWGGVYYELYADGLLPSWGERIIENNHSELRRTTLGLNLDLQHSARWSSHLTVGQDFLDFETRSVPTLSGSDSLTFIGTERHSAPSVRFRTAVNQPLGDLGHFSLTAGADRAVQSRFGFDSFHRLTLEPRIIFSQGDVLEERRVLSGGFLSARASAGGWAVGGGLRADHEDSIPIDSTGVLLSPHVFLGHTGLGLGTWQLVPAISWSRGAISPAAFMRSGLHPEIEANPNLAPQRLTAMEARVALVGRPGMPMLSVTAFSQTTDDVIALVPGDSEADRYLNTDGSITNRGVEGALSWDGSPFRFLATGSLLQNEVDGVPGEIDGEPVRYDASPAWTLWSEAALGLEGWLPVSAEVGGRVRGVGTRWANDRRAVIESLYSEADLDIHRDFDAVSEIDLFASVELRDGIRVRFDALNLTDSVIAQVPEMVVAGRELRLSLEAGFGN